MAELRRSREAVLTRAASTGRPLCAAAAVLPGACGVAGAEILVWACDNALVGSGAPGAALPAGARLCGAAGSSSQSWQLMACQQDGCKKQGTAPTRPATAEAFWSWGRLGHAQKQGAERLPETETASPSARQSSARCCC